MDRRGQEIEKRITGKFRENQGKPQREVERETAEKHLERNSERSREKQKVKVWSERARVDEKH